MDNRSDQAGYSAGSKPVSTPDSDPNEQPAAITSRGAAIERDLDSKFGQAANQ